MIHYIIEQIEDKYDTYLSEDEIALIYEVMDVIEEGKPSAYVKDLLKTTNDYISGNKSGAVSLVRDIYKAGKKNNARFPSLWESLFDRKTAKKITYKNIKDGLDVNLRMELLANGEPLDKVSNMTRKEIRKMMGEDTYKEVMTRGKHELKKQAMTRNIVKGTAATGAAAGGYGLYNTLTNEEK